MRRLQRVVWSKGMFLTPQHFQVQEQYLEDALQFRFAASNFANWGVITLAIDEEALVNGVFRLRFCRGILTDGLLFEMPEADELPPSREIDEFFLPSKPALDVFLAIPEQKPGTRNFTLTPTSAPASISAAPTRFVAEIEKVADATLGSDEKEIHVGRKSLRVLFDGENRSGFNTMRIARIARNAKGQYILDPHFIAPCLDIASSEYLMMLIRRQIEVLTAKAETLSRMRREKSQDLADFTTSEVSSYWLLHTINSFRPELEHIWNVRRGHPEPAFVAMLRLAGALSTFSMADSVQSLPRYDHEDLGGCFTELDAKIRGLLETVFPSKCIPVPLTLSDTLVWSGAITEDHYLRNSQFYLSVSAKIPVQDLIKNVPHLARVSAPAEIHRLVRNSLPGIGLRHVAVPPPAIPRRLENQYFELEQSGPLWQGVERARSLSVFVPGDISEPKMELLIVLQ